MGLWLRLMTLLGSARHARASVDAAREGLHTLKSVTDQYRTVAFQRTRQRALEGEAEAQLQLGEHFYEGGCVEQDYTEAFAWFLKAAQQNQVKAQLNVGLMLSIGRGTPKDGAEASKWLHLAAAQGDPAAQKLLTKATRRLSPAEIAEGARRARLG